ncbi:MAG: hypothetical protein ACD_79C01095G0001, partial [uncultured bacterium]
MSEPAIELRTRMEFLESYSDILSVHLIISDNNAEKSELEIEYNKTLKACNTLLDEVDKTHKTNPSIAKKNSVTISKNLINLRLALINYIIGRKPTEIEESLLNDIELKNNLLRIVGFVTSLNEKSFNEAKKAHLFLKEILTKLFISYRIYREFKNDEKEAISFALEHLNRWLRLLDKNKLDKMIEGTDSYLPDTNKGNREIIEELVSHGYKKELFTKGVEVSVRLDTGLTEEKKLNQIKSATFELIGDIAFSLNIQKINNEPLTLDYAEKLDSYKNTKEFIETIQKENEIPKSHKDRMKAILESVYDLEKQQVEEEVEPHIFKTTIRKDFFTECLSGVGVPGCYAPTGIHKEMPFIHAIEFNSGFIQIFNEKNKQIANAVIVFTNEGAFVYPGYNGSAYDMDIVFGEVLMELSKYVPRIFLNGDSAGKNYLEQYSEYKCMKFVKPPIIFKDQYFDAGGVEDDTGNLVIERMCYVIIEEAIRNGGGFENRNIHILTK